MTQSGRSMSALKRLATSTQRRLGADPHDGAESRSKALLPLSCRTLVFRGRVIRDGLGMCGCALGRFLQFQSLFVSADVSGSVLAQ